MGAIKEISAIVERLSEISSTIAAAVEEQGAAPWRSTNSATWKAVSSSLRDASSNCNPQNERKTIGIRVDATEAGAKSQDFDIPIADWFFHPNDEIDLAAVSVSIDVLKSKGLETAFSSNDEMALTKSQMADVCVKFSYGNASALLKLKLSPYLNTNSTAAASSGGRIAFASVKPRDQVLISSFIVRCWAPSR